MIDLQWMQAILDILWQAVQTRWYAAVFIGTTLIGVGFAMRNVRRSTCKLQELKDEGQNPVECLLVQQRISRELVLIATLLSCLIAGFAWLFGLRPLVILFLLFVPATVTLHSHLIHQHAGDIHLALFARDHQSKEGRGAWDGYERRCKAQEDIQ